jgi:hypothetical protein
MEREVGWDKKSVADQIVVLFLLMPILRQSIENYVLDWNAHTIRSQRSHPHIISGVPNTIHAYPEEGVLQYGDEFHQPTYDHLSQLLEDYSKLCYGLLFVHDITNRKHKKAYVKC